MKSTINREGGGSATTNGTERKIEMERVVTLGFTYIGLVGYFILLFFNFFYQ